MTRISRRTAVLASVAAPLAAAFGTGPSSRAWAAAANPMLRNPTKVTVNALTVMSTEPRLTDWMRLLRAASMEQECGTAHPYTVFPLTDAAFAETPDLMPALMPWQTASSAPGALPAFPDTTAISAFVRRHVVEGKIDPVALAGSWKTVRSLDGSTITIDATGPSTRVTWQGALDNRLRSASLDGAPIECLNASIFVLGNVKTA